MNKEPPDMNQCNDQTYSLSISPATLIEWQEIVNLVSQLASVPVGLIMRTDTKEIEVFVASRREGITHPYTVGDHDELEGSGLYCEEVIKSRAPLEVMNALKSAEWDHNPDLIHHMISYLGFPIMYPDGNPFGTLCILDTKEHHYPDSLMQVMEKMRNLIQNHLRVEQFTAATIEQNSNLLTKNMELERLNHLLKVRDRQYRLIAENSSDMIWILNITTEDFSYYSPSVERLRGFSVREALAQSLAETFSEDSLETMRALIHTVRSEPLASGAGLEQIMNEMRYRCKNGESSWMENSISFITNEKGENEMIGISRLIEERRKTEAKIRKMSYHDQLTGIHNRYFLNAFLEEHNLCTSGFCKGICLIMFDIDAFKGINDTWGHLTGDKVLNRLASTVKGLLTKTSKFIRYGGDEFLILLTDSSLGQALDYAENVRYAIEKEGIGRKVGFTCSFGVAQYLDGESFTDLCNRADSAMYRAKNQGRNCICTIPSQQNG